MAALIRQQHAKRHNANVAAAAADMALQPSLQPNKHTTETLKVRLFWYIFHVYFVYARTQYTTKTARGY